MALDLLISLMWPRFAYLQTQIGYEVKESGMPGLTGSEVERLYDQGMAWLEGAKSAGSVQ